MKKIYLGIGGDEGETLSTIKRALSLLKERIDCVDFEHSHFYRTSPFEMNSDCWFVNAVCSFQTTLSLKDVFDLTCSVERALGKISKPKNASRPIDIDLLFYGSTILKEGNLEIPHPRWKERLFVLQPLSDLVSAIELDRHGKKEIYDLKHLIKDLLDHSSQELYLLEKNPHLK